MALGLTLTYKVTKVPNFAHAEYVTIGSYMGVVAVNVWERGIVEAVALSFVASAGVALVADELVFKPLFLRGATPLHLLVASIGVGLVIRYILSIFANVYNMLSVKANLLAATLVSFGPGANLTTLHLGAFWSVYAPTDPEVGWRALLWVFAAAILGGFVSVPGTIAGGYVVGASEAFGITFLYYGFGVDTAYKPMIALAIIVAVFLIRPTGFAGLTLHDFIDGVRRSPRRLFDRVKALATWVKRLTAPGG